MYGISTQQDLPVMTGIHRHLVNFIPIRFDSTRHSNSMCDVKFLSHVYYIFDRVIIKQMYLMYHLNIKPIYSNIFYIFLIEGENKKFVEFINDNYLIKFDVYIEFNIQIPYHEEIYLNIRSLIHVFCYVF